MENRSTVTSEVLDRIFRFSQYFRDYPLCHSRPDRSFTYNDRHFGLCARCATMYLSGFITLLTTPMWIAYVEHPYTIYFGCLLLLPTAADGFTQLLGDRESTNRLRVVTGIPLGIGTVLVVHGVIYQFV